MGKKLWTDGEVYILIDYLGSHLDAYYKGVKERYYANAKEHLEGEGYDKTPTQIKTKMVELETSYKTYKLKLSQSGYGVKETDSAGIKAMLEKKCPYFYEMDEILGARHNTTPPVVMEPGRTVIDGVDGAPPTTSESQAEVLPLILTLLFVAGVVENSTMRSGLQPEHRCGSRATLDHLAETRMASGHALLPSIG